MVETRLTNLINARMDNLMHLIEKNRNVIAYNSNPIICNLCRRYHTTYECMQAQNMDYYNDFLHFNSNFDQCNSNWVTLMIMVEIIKYAYSDSSYYYDGYQPKCIQHESKLSWELTLEKFDNKPFS